MSEKSSLSQPDDLATRQTRRSPMSGMQFALWLALLATLALLTVNVWLLSRSMRQQRASSREHAFWVLCQPGAPAATRERAFSQLVAAGNKEWRSADLHELNLTGISLPGADLQAAFFVRSTLAGATLARARFCDRKFLGQKEPLAGARGAIDVPIPFEQRGSSVKPGERVGTVGWPANIQTAEADLQQDERQQADQHSNAWE